MRSIRSGFRRSAGGGFALVVCDQETADFAWWAESSRLLKSSLGNPAGGVAPPDDPFEVQLERHIASQKKHINHIGTH